MCGFLGMIGVEGAVREVYEGPLAIQHRGQDAAGIITWDDARFHVKKGDGLVRDIFTAANMDRLQGTVAVGHVRYPPSVRGEGKTPSPSPSTSRTASSWPTTGTSRTTWTCAAI